MKTGEYENIFFDTLEDDEKEIYKGIPVDVVRHLDEEIRLITIRERRMMQRIGGLMEGGGRVVTSVVSERGARGQPGTVTTTEEATLVQVQRIEDALTRVQAQKSRLLDLKHKIESGKGPEEPDIDRYMRALGKVAESVWGDDADE